MVASAVAGVAVREAFGAVAGTAIAPCRWRSRRILVPSSLNSRAVSLESWSKSISAFIFGRSIWSPYSSCTPVMPVREASSISEGSIYTCPMKSDKTDWLCRDKTALWIPAGCACKSCVALPAVLALACNGYGGIVAEVSCAGVEVAVASGLRPRYAPVSHFHGPGRQPVPAGYP